MCEKEKLVAIRDEECLSAREKQIRVHRWWLSVRDFSGVLHFLARKLAGDSGIGFVEFEVNCCVSADVLTLGVGDRIGIDGDSWNSIGGIRRIFPAATS